PCGSIARSVPTSGSSTRRRAHRHTGRAASPPGTSSPARVSWWSPSRRRAWSGRSAKRRPAGERTAMARRVGLISDTPGRLHPAVPRVLAGVAHPLHTGASGNPDGRAELEGLAPVTAFCGNADRPPLSRLPRTRCVELGGIRILLVHQGMERGRPTPELEAAL